MASRTGERGEFWCARFLVCPGRKALIALLLSTIGLTPLRGIVGGAENSAPAFLIKDISPGDSYPAELRDVGGVLYFTADDGEHGRRLWRSDGTEAGTVPAEEPTPSNLHVVYLPGVEGCSDAPLSPTEANGVLFFLASDDEHGCELWKTDGTEAGTSLVRDVNPGSPGAFTHGSPQLTPFEAQLFFIADDGTHGLELWRTDGTQSRTRLVRDINVVACGTVPPAATCSAFIGNPDFPMFLALGGTLFFVATDGVTGFELWKTDGSEAGTVLVKDINQGPADSVVYAEDYGDFLPYFTRLDQAVLFVATDGATGFELWKTDGGEAGTVLVKDINPGEADSLFPAGGQLLNPPYQSLGAVLDGVALFAANDGAHGVELWKSDGTPAGTMLVKDIRLEGDGFPEGFARVATSVVFQANDGRNGTEPWQSDGTAQGTRLVADVAPGPAPSAAYLFTVAGRYVFFGANDQTHGVELWGVSRSAIESNASRSPAAVRSDGCAVQGGADSSCAFAVIVLGVGMAGLRRTARRK